MDGSRPEVLPPAMYNMNSSSGSSWRPSFSKSVLSVPAALAVSAPQDPQVGPGQ